MNPYLDLTREFNAGRLRAVIASGQAVVLHRLAIMSKDGDWILLEDPEMEIEGLPLGNAHRILVARAGNVLPVEVEGSEQWIG
jgi:hypothetical protein